MAAAKLVTRCPACRTAFRLVADQLRLRQGLVRCGQCDTVFDAREHLIELPPPEPAAAGTALPTDAPAPQPSEPTPASHEDGHNAQALPGRHEHADTRADDEERPPIAPFDPGYDPGYDVPALDAPTVMLYQTQAEADQAAQAAGDRDEPEADSATQDLQHAPDPQVAQDAPSAVFVPGNVEEPDADAGVEPGTAETVELADVADVADVADAASVPEAGPAAAPWPELDPAKLSGDEAAPAADMLGPAEAVAATGAPTDAPANAHPEPTAAIPSASGYLRAEAQDDFPEIPAAAREPATRQWEGREAAATPAFAPDFLRHARERGPGPARRKRLLQQLAIALLVLAALLQATYLARSQLSGHFPMLRPAFEALCAPLGCAVAPWRDIDALRIESSQLQKQDEESDAYLLAVTLRNQGRATVALPAIELVMTDLQDQLLLRKVLQPADYLEADQQAFAMHGLRAGTELPVRVRFRSQQAAANYRVLIFYP